MGVSHKKQATPVPLPGRGSLVVLKKPLEGASEFGIVLSNDIQNEASEYVLLVPLQRRKSRLRAPFAVDFGRKDGFRELHVARCDWVTRMKKEQISRIERATFPKPVLSQIEEALSVALGFQDKI